MIRVNLLPHAAERRASGPEGSQTWVVAIAGLVIIELVALLFFHQSKEDERAAAQAEVQRYASQIAQINNLLKDHKKVKAALATLRAREDAIAKLQAGRKGPTEVLLELSRILTRGKGPTADPGKLESMRQRNPLNVYNPGWDPRRVWLNKYEEASRKVTLVGLAKDGSDVYEFAQRLKLSRYFGNVRLQQGGEDPLTKGLGLVRFALEVKVTY